jgi:CRP/FNR family transcriptional regulator
MVAETSTQNGITIFASVPSFTGLDAETLEDLARAATQREYAPDQVVFVEGDPCAGLYVVQDGWLKSLKLSLSGREQVIRFVGPSEVFNEIGVFADAANQVSVVALEQATVWVIPRHTLLQLLDRRPQLARVVTQNLATRVLHLMALVEDLSLRTVEARLARVLLEHAGERELQRPRWATQAEMAARIGTVPDVLNRALRKLAEDGLIHVERHQIQILDRLGLEERANREQ